MPIRNISNKKIIFDPRKNFKDKFCGVDHPDLITDKYWFKTCPVQNFDYQFNSWGFRGLEYEKYIGKPVVLCLGDSATTNIAGPIEHSWPSLIQEHFDIPCLNFGLEGAGNDAIRYVYDAACRIFDVQHTFVLYSFLHRRFENNKFKSEPHPHNENIKHFQKYQIPGASFNFLPYWYNSEEETEFFNTLVDPYLDLEERFWSDKIQRFYVYPEEYKKLAGSDWPSYDEFLRGGQIPDSDIYKSKLDANYFFKNRDSLHISIHVNEKIKNNLYQQFLQRGKK